MAAINCLTFVFAFSAFVAKALECDWNQLNHWKLELKRCESQSMKHLVKRQANPQSPEVIPLGFYSDLVDKFPVARIKVIVDPRDKIYNQDMLKKILKILSAKEIYVEILSPSQPLNVSTGLQKSGILLLSRSQNKLLEHNEKSSFTNDVIWMAGMDKEPPKKFVWSLDKLRLDSDTYFFWPSNNSDGSVSLIEAYKKSKSTNVDLNEMGSWNEVKGLVIPIEEKWERRRNLLGVHFSVAALSVSSSNSLLSAK